MRRIFVCLALPLLLACCQPAIAQSTTLSSETSNNTSACTAANSPAYCAAGFTGMSDSSSGTYNPAPGHVSDVDIHSALYSGNTTKVFAHFQPWFCMNGTSTATGTTSSTCNGHVQVGYNSNDANTVAGQAADMLRRGVNGLVIDWYGARNAIADGTTAKFRDYLAPQCSGSNSCPLLFALMEDQGAWSAQCPFNANGTDQTNCITQALENDLDYMNANYFGSPAYLRVDNTTMSTSPNGHPVVFFFICESCFTNPSPNWTTIWNSVRAHVLSYATGDPVLWFIYRNSTGFTHVQSDGAFAWVNHYGSNDPYGLVYLDNFYDVAVQNPTKQTYGGAWKGFDNTNAPWKPTQSITPQNCGQTWLSTLQEETHNSDFGINHQLPFLGLVTWNDYDEGTEVETGIDNCLSLSASVSGSVLSWTPSFSSVYGTEQTVDHYAVFDSTDGQGLTQVATLPTGTHSLDLTTVNLPSGSSTLYVEAVGAPFIQNRMSSAVSYSPAATAQDFSLSASPTSQSVYAGNTSSAYSIVISPTNGFTGAVQLSATGLPAGASASFSVNPATTSSSMTIQTSGSTPAGTYTIAITGMSGTLTHATAVTLVVNPPTFSLSVSPTSASVKRGSATSFTVKVSPQGAFTGTVTLTATGLPTGMTGNFSPSSITGSGSSTLAIGTSKTTKIGTYTIKVTGTSNGVTNSASIKLKVTS